MSASSDQETIHIVDDDPAVRSALGNLVNSVGYAVQSYESVDRLLEKKSDVVSGCLILDVRLPGINGLDFFANMPDLGIRLPVILITGHGDIPMSVRGMKAGAVDFLTKPFRENEVVDAISRALSLDRYRRRDESYRSDLAKRYESLTKRERQVMALVASGLMNKQIAGELELSEITVKVHRGSLMKKLALKTLPDLVKLSVELQSLRSIEELSDQG